MGRIIKKIKIKPESGSPIEREVFAVFDTGSERSYVKKGYIPKDTKCSKIPTFSSGLGGKHHKITEGCNMVGEIQGLEFDFSPHPVDDIGAIDGNDIGVLIGSTAMEEWD
ncbi:MAG: hypothetical protein ACOC35_10270, partial [Promethearchaeia archaeon]